MVRDVALLATSECLLYVHRLKGAPPSPEAQRDPFPSHSPLY